ncbi:phospholipase D family protein [Jeotgalibacillus salarius]|uniref:phospholipase D n=1 Tax=Jeotgalibacillus salarius TaxID=546023 RepID=A0A4Y8LLR0_9BACL|nr:phospholipase D family protein [Jeotgalibacillus salarius]TFE02913.1 phospholipase [Jeotgalibacillus salarius]
MKKKKWFKKKRWYLLAFLVVYLVILFYNQFKPLPEGISIQSEEYPSSDVSFYRDLTYEKDGERVLDHQIYDRVHEMIDEAEEFVVIDIFMMDGRVSEDKGYPDLAGNLMDKIIEKKSDHPDMPIIFITDPFNTGYGSYPGEWLEPLKDAGVEVIISNLEPLRDSTPIYSAFWRMGPKYFGKSENGWLPNGFVDGGPEMTVRSYLDLGNIKANHRKVVITDQSGMVLSANAHNESGFHSNVAYEVNGQVIKDMLNAEEAVARMSGSHVDFPDFQPPANQDDAELTVSYSTEGKTKAQVLQAITDTKENDEIWIAMYYLSEPDIVDELVASSDRDVKVSIVMDPNETAFGNKKTGLPNRPVANEMIENSGNKIDIKWYNVDIEQYHPKMMYVRTGESSKIISGSTNFTMRNMRDYNLESDIVISGPSRTQVMEDTEAYFNQLWNNNGAEYTVPLEEFQTTLSFWQRGIYWIQRKLKLTTY